NAMPYRHLEIYGAFCGVNIPIRAGVIPSVLPRPSLRRDFGMSIRAVSELGIPDLRCAPSGMTVALTSSGMTGGWAASECRNKNSFVGRWKQKSLEMMEAQRANGGEAVRCK